MPVLEPPSNLQAGEHVSSDTPAPSRGQNEATEYVVTIDLEAADLADPTFMVSGISLEGNISGNTWVPYATTGTWNGGSVGRDGTIRKPYVSWMASDNRVLTRVRVRWTQSRAARVGVTMDANRVDI